ncbi:MAG: DVUA0089 family protein [Parahaliea sp.]
MKKWLAVLFVCVFAGNANAALINFTGQIAFHNDVIYTYFTLDNDTTNIRMWTDSFQNGTNFDPITALWDSAGNLIDENDDNDLINPATQTYYDSGFSLPSLAAGNYLFTVATYANFAVGTTLADGFIYDSEAPIPLPTWNQPANSTNMGPFWSVWLDGVDSATNPGTNPVPAPASLLLVALGLMGVAVFRRKRSV